MIAAPVAAAVPKNYAAVWIDHREARVIRVSIDESTEETVKTPQHVHREHPKGESGAKEHPDDAKRFFHQVAKALEGATHVVVVGPSTAKVDFVRYAHEHDQPLATKIVGSETVDHPTDGQLAAYARKYFKFATRP